VAQDFYSFEKALRELHIEEEELKRLVSEGEIRAFRDQEKMKFKKEDIDRFKRDHGGKDVIEALDAAQGGTRDVPTVNASTELPEELVFDEDDAASQQVGMETAAISDDSFLAEETAPVVKPVERASVRARRGAAPATARPAVRVRTPVVVESAGEPGWMKALLIATALFLFLGAMASYDAAKQHSSPMTQWLADMFKSSSTK
jgi:hypothetical protein